MHITVKVSGVDRLRADIALERKRLSDLTVPLEQGLALTRDAAIRRFAMEGDPKWAPSRKTTSITIQTKKGPLVIQGDGGRTGTNTGNLRRSIQIDPVTNNYGRVGTSVPYARFFQYGTGVFATGPRAGRTEWTIGTIYGPRDPRGLKDTGPRDTGPGIKGTRPLPAKVLAWRFGSRLFFAREVTIKGSPPRPFLLLDPPLVEAITARFKAAVAGAGI